MPLKLLVPYVVFKQQNANLLLAIWEYFLVLVELFGHLGQNLGGPLYFCYFFFFYNNSAKCMDTLVAYYANLMCALYILLTIASTN